MQRIAELVRGIFLVAIFLLTAELVAARALVQLDYLGG
jgi:hypothetical protein